MKRLLATGIFLLAFAGLTPVRAESPPDQTARAVTDEILKLIKANRDAYAKDYRKLFAAVDEHVLPHYDFPKMAQQVVGRPAWSNANEQQRERFTKEFRDLLVRTYATALLKYSNQEVVYQPLRLGPNDKTVVVKSQIKSTDGSPPIAINYSFYLKSGGWKVYDMAIEGPSIVTTYQRVYGERLRKDNLDALIASMAQENERARGGGGGAPKSETKK